MMQTGELQAQLHKFKEEFDILLLENKEQEKFI